MRLRVGSLYWAKPQAVAATPASNTSVLRGRGSFSNIQEEKAT
jgi:hypothetical protein